MSLIANNEWALQIMLRHIAIIISSPDINNFCADYRYFKKGLS